MGCDIHFYVERLEDGKWVSAERWTSDEYSDEPNPPLTLEYKNSFYHDRNYDLFAILANVRNGRGFAGCDTGDGFVPIIEPRGLPEDLSDPVKSEADRWDGDGHSHSWLTVEELLDYDWTRETKQRGYVHAVEFWKWSRYDRERGESPSGYCGGVGGGSTKIVSLEEMESISIEADAIAQQQNWDAAVLWLKENHPSTYTQADCTQPYYKTVRRFWSDSIPRLLRVGKPSEVRCVFWFDN